MKKKVLAALLCAAMVGTTLAGCGSSGSDSLCSYDSNYAAWM